MKNPKTGQWLNADLDSLGLSAFLLIRLIESKAFSDWRSSSPNAKDCCTSINAGFTPICKFVKNGCQ
jgi:hypothetical protein